MATKGPLTTGRRVCVVVEGWPRISTTFIAQELVGLEREGMALWLATFGRTDELRQSIHADLLAPVFRLANSLSHPLNVMRAWTRVRKLPGFSRALQLF